MEENTENAEQTQALASTPEWAGAGDDFDVFQWANEVDEVKTT